MEKSVELFIVFIVVSIGFTLALASFISNLMVDLNPSNVKLRDRAVRIVRELTGVDYATARAVLEKSDWVVKAAWKRLGAPRGGKN